MYESLEARLTAAGIRTTKLQLAFDALEFANGNISEAKRIVAKHGDRISARTWHKAITARIEHLSTEDWTRNYDVERDHKTYQAR